MSLLEDYAKFTKLFKKYRTVLHYDRVTACDCALFELDGDFQELYRIMDQQAAKQTHRA